MDSSNDFYFQIVSMIFIKPSNSISHPEIITKIRYQNPFLYRNEI